LKINNLMSYWQVTHTVVRYVYHIIGALILPPGVGKYDKGLFNTQAGPLYVNPGIGTYAYPIRFNCRPEITVITI